MKEQQKGGHYCRPSEGEIARRALVALLVLDAQLNNWTYQANSVPGLSIHLPVNPLNEVLDALGCPPDNAGHVSEDHPAFFCRDWLTEEWYDQVRGEKPFDPEGYLDWLQTALNGLKVRTN